MGIALLNWAPRLQDYQAHKYYSYINLCGVVKCDRLSFAFTWPVSLKFYFLAVVKVDAFGNFLDVFHWQSSFSHKQRLGERGRCRPLRSRARAKLPPPLKTHLKPVLPQATRTGDPCWTASAEETSKHATGLWLLFNSLLKPRFLWLWINDKVPLAHTAQAL